MNNSLQDPSRWRVGTPELINIALTLATLVLVVFTFLTYREAVDAGIRADRAWVGPVDMEIRGSIDKAQRFTTALKLVNFGRSPATGVSKSLTVGTITRSDEDGWSGISPPHDDACSSSKFQADNTVLFPGEGAAVGALNSLAVGTVDDAILSGLKTFYYQGCVRYRTAGADHRSAYCFYLHSIIGEAPQTWGFRSCPTGNEAD